MIEAFDPVADVWRWWAAPGALLGLALLIPRLLTIARAVSRGATAPDTIMPDVARFTALSCAVLFMIAVLIAGTIIPLATDDRLAGWSMDDTWFVRLMTVAWFFWGAGCWGIAISLAPNWQAMAKAAGLTALASWVATQGTMGAML